MPPSLQAIRGDLRARYGCARMSLPARDLQLKVIGSISSQRERNRFDCAVMRARELE
jgi:hypothetical protein